MKSIMYYHKLYKVWFFLLSVLLYLLSIHIYDIVPANIGYQYTFLLPLCFIICFFFLLWDLVMEYKSPYLIAFCVVSFFRYVILPYALLNEGNYYGFAYISPSSENLQLASWLIMYELVIVSIIIRVFYKKIVTKGNKVKSLIVQKNNSLYVAFFFVFLAFILIIPQAREGISIFFDINKSVNEEIGSYIILFIRECFIISKYLIYFAILSVVYKNKSLNKSTLIYIVILLIALMLINVQIGTNRKSIISDAFALFFLLIIVFPKKKYSTVAILSSTALIMILAFTAFRGFINQDEGLGTYFFSLNVLQPYLLGEYNVALAIEAKQYFSNQIGIGNLIMDIFRPAFGIGTLLSDVQVLRSGEIFAQRLSLGGLYRQDQIVPTIGQGYMYFGIIISPIFSVVAALLGIYCDSLYKKASSLESTFFSAYFAINLAQAMALSVTILINTITFKLAIIIPLYYANLLINKSFQEKYK